MLGAPHSYLVKPKRIFVLEFVCCALHNTQTILHFTAIYIRLWFVHGGYARKQISKNLHRCPLNAGTGFFTLPSRLFMRLKHTG